MRFLLIIPILLLSFLTVYGELIRRADYNTDEEDQKKASEEKRFFYSFLLFFECLFSAATAAFVIGIFRGEYPIISFMVSAIIISSSVCVLPTLLRRIITAEFTRSAKKLGEVMGGIDDFCAAAYRLLKHGGKFYCVWRPDRLVGLICAMRNNRLEPKVLQTVCANTESAPSMVLVMAQKGGNEGLITPPALFLNRDGSNELTERAARIYDTLSFE